MKNYLIIGVLSLFVVAGCKKDQTESEKKVVKNFDTAYSNSNVLLYSNLAKGIPAGSGCFYASKTKIVSDSAHADTATVDISFADIYDHPGISFISPNRRQLNTFGHLIPATDLPGIGVTYFSETSLNFDQASADDVFNSPDPTLETVKISAPGTVFLFKNKFGRKGIIKVNSWQGVEFDSKYYSHNPPPNSVPITTNITFSIKVVAK